MMTTSYWVLKWGALILAVIALTLFAVRADDSQRGPPLDLWHTFVPHEMSAPEIDKADWAQYLEAEAKLFAEVRAEVTDKLPPSPETRAIATLPKARSTRRSSAPTGIAPTSWTRPAHPPARWCCCTA